LQAIAGLAADGRQIVTRARAEAGNYLRSAKELHSGFKFIITSLLSDLLDEKVFAI
jgi:20S proteasome alpha/beta subunit